MYKLLTLVVHFHKSLSNSSSKMFQITDPAENHHCILAFSIHKLHVCSSGYVPTAIHEVCGTELSVLSVLSLTVHNKSMKTQGKVGE
jgi:hypothetical protein